MHKLLAPQPKHDGGDEHEHARQTECVMRSKVWIVQEDRAEPGRKCRTQVNRQIEPAEYFGEQMLVPFAKLIADVCGNARFDSACADRTQAQPEKETKPRIIESKRQMSETVDNR